MDTNILLHAVNADSPSHEAAYGWVALIQHMEDVAVSEFILAELYGLLVFGYLAVVRSRRRLIS